MADRLEGPRLAFEAEAQLEDPPLPFGQGIERTLPPGGGAHLEVEAGLAAARRVLASDTGVDLDELLLIGSFLRKPPPELKVVPLEQGAILRAAQRVTARNGHVPVSDTGPGPQEPSLF